MLTRSFFDGKIRKTKELILRGNKPMKTGGWGQIDSPVLFLFLLLLKKSFCLETL